MLRELRSQRLREFFVTFVEAGMREKLPACFDAKAWGGVAQKTAEKSDSAPCGEGPRGVIASG